MRKRIIAILQYSFFLGAGIFLVWWQLKSMTEPEKEEFYAALSNANYWLMIPVVIMSLLSHLSRSMRWKILMDPLGYKPALRNVFAVTMVGYLANSAIPRLGEILKCSLLARYEKLKFDKLFGTILVERTFDFVCYLIFIGITVLLQLNLIGSYVKSKLELMASSSGIPLWLKLLFVVLCIGILVWLFRMLVKKFPDNKLIARINLFAKGVIAGFASIKNLKKRKQFIAHTIFIWAMYLLQIYLGFSAMESTSRLGIEAAFAVLSLATLAMIATPGGIGSFPIFVMETLVIYSIASPSGKAFGWLIWGGNTAIVILAGLVALVLLPYFNKEKKHESNPVHTS